MKRLVFSIYTDGLNPHSSVDEYKRTQFRMYKQKIIDVQQGYAFYCNADYALHTTETTDYNLLQFEKLMLFQEAFGRYDEVLYIDFDLLPITNKNFFDNFDLNKLCAYSFGRPLDKEQLLDSLKWDQFDPMNVYAKTCCKNAMLLIHGIGGNNELINTGVVAGNKKVAEQLDFKGNVKEFNEIFQEALSDNIFPENIFKNWFPNNEVFISYLVEKNNIPFTNIGIQWNFILDKFCPKPTAGCHFLHHVNKQFELSFSNVV